MEKLSLTALPLGRADRMSGVNEAGHGLKRMCLKRTVTCGTEKREIQHGIREREATNNFKSCDTKVDKATPF